ncbi:magnesium/cobalt transporter CorA [Patescibacteria group bacterium]|nr:magnesium/cobalt transporter CorA [Patescibacteria group bacterium]
MHSIETIKHKNVSWINLVNPTDEMLEDLARRYKFHHLDVEDIMSENQRSKIDEYPRYLFMVLHLPIIDKKYKHVDIEEVDIFISQNYVITIHEGKSEVFKEYFEKCKESLKVKKELMGKGTGYLLYEMLDRAFDNVFPMVDQLELGVQGIEKELFALKQENQRDKLKDVLLLKKDIITLRRAIAPQRQVIAQLEHKHTRFLPANLEIYFDNVVDKIEKIWANLENLKELVVSVQEINESIISHNTNNIIKILTMFSVIMMPMTVITGAYGMNLNLPFGQQAGGHQWTFLLILMFMMCIAGGMLLFFKKKNWL